MPAPQITSMAKKAGKSEAEAEKLWAEAKAAAKKEGHAEDYAYVMGIFKKMIGAKKESIDRYRVFLNGSEVQMIRDGVQVALGENESVDGVRAKVQDLLDHDVDSVFDLGGFVGTLAEIERRVFRDWLMFCNGGTASALGG